MRVLIVGRSQAVLNQILPLLRGDGFEAFSTVADDEAVAHLASGNVDAVVIGMGVQGESRQRIRSAAPARVAVIEGALGDKSLENYVRQELLPALRRAKAGEPTEG